MPIFVLYIFRLSQSDCGIKASTTPSTISLHAANMNPSIPSPQAVTQAIWHSIEVQVLGGNIIAQMSLSMSFDFLTPVGKQWVLQKYMYVLHYPFRVLANFMLQVRS